mmetsp:Transcript_20495/g.38349  ORF Transcript_20495/g.38349 Transcript_20495/m.38349 type:complete len:331 (-) Transcript_20495:61-1053(-)
MSQTWHQELAFQWQYHVDEFQRLQENQPFWMPKSYAVGKMLPAVVATAVLCSVLFWIVSPSVVDILLPGNKDTKLATKTTDPTVLANKRIKMRYQLTNLCFNLAVGSVGVYCHFWVLPTLPSTQAPSIMDRIPLHEDLYLLSAMQLGYQLWALPMGLLCVQEPTEMIMHHLAVVLSSTLSGFSYLGFRYFSVYFYGLMELSSIPLAVMNAFKDNPEWIQTHPLLYLLTRAAFSFSFLYIRIYMWFFIGPRYLMHDFFFFWTIPNWGLEKSFVLMQFCFGVFLGLLQLYWAVLVIRGIVAFFVPKNKKKKLPLPPTSKMQSNGYGTKTKQT